VSESLSTVMLVIVLGLSWSVKSNAQTAAGTILGTVRDASGAVVPNAIVTVAMHRFWRALARPST
jgi:hypothetical protein